MRTQASSKSSRCFNALASSFLAVFVFFSFPSWTRAQAPIAPQAAVEGEKTILFIGDSLTAGYGVRKEEAFPALVEKKLKDSGRKVKVVNGGISGSVTAEADRRLRWFLRAKPEVLVLILGANDALKGTPPKVIKANLAKAVDLAKENGVRVLLGGIRIFTNFGPDYAKEFEAVYADLAKEKQIRFIPFILEGVALDKNLNLADGKHPNPKGHEVIANTVAKALEPLL